MSEKETVVIELTRSSHPEFVYFGTTTVRGKQIAKHGTDKMEMYNWADKVKAAGEPYGFTFQVHDQMGI